MPPQITPAALDDKPRLLALVELYVYDLSALLGLDVADDGRFRIPPLDGYWTDPRGHPVLLRVDEKVSGCALLQG